MTDVLDARVLVHFYEAVKQEPLLSLMSRQDRSPPGSDRTQITC